MNHKGRASILSATRNLPNGEKMATPLPPWELSMKVLAGSLLFALPATVALALPPESDSWTLVESAHLRVVTDGPVERARTAARLATRPVPRKPSKDSPPRPKLERRSRPWRRWGGGWGRSGLDRPAGLEQRIEGGSQGIGKEVARGRTREEQTHPMGIGSHARPRVAGSGEGP